MRSIYLDLQYVGLESGASIVMDMDLLEVTEKVKALLKLHPEGLSITSLSSLSKINRNTLVKYLEIMQSQGSVGMRQVGVAKVYYPADRIPISAVRRFCRHYLVLDHLLNVIETSASVPACLGMPAGERAGRRICDQYPGLRGIVDLEARLRSALRDEEQTVRWSTGRHLGNKVFSVSFIPTVLESGRPAASLVLDDITESDLNGGSELDTLRSQALFEDQIEYIVRLSPEGYVRWANPGYYRIAGLPKHDLVGRRFRPPVTGNNRDRWNRRLRSLTIQHPVTTIECRISTRNEVSLWQRWTLRALYASSGMLLEYQLVGHDVGGCAAAQGEFLQYKEELEELVPSGTTEKSLCGIEDLIKKAFDESPIGSALYDRAGTLIHANKAIQEFSGTFSTLGALGTDQFGCPNLACERIGALQQSRPVGCSRPIDPEESKLSVVRLETTITPLCDPGEGTPLGHLVQVQSVGERGADETAAGSPRDLLGDFIQDIPEAIFAIDRKGRVISWNRAIEEITGIRAADILGRGNYEYSLPFYRERIPMLVDSVARTDAVPGSGYTDIQRKGNCLIAERIISLPDGYTRVIREKAFPVRVAGEVIGAIESVYDITTLRRTEELLKRERMFNIAVLEAVDALIIVTDENGCIAWCNEQCKTLTGHAGLELTGREVRELFDVDLEADEEQPIRWSRRTFTQPGARRFEIYTGIYPGQPPVNLEISRHEQMGSDQPEEPTARSPPDL